MTEATAETQLETRGPSSSLDEIAALVAESDRLVVATHMNPDGDAVGSARAMELVLRAIGKDVVVYMPDDTVPHEYEFVQPERQTHDVPADIAERVLVCVDCGNAARVHNDELLRAARSVVNIDHHGDNTHFGSLNHIRASASCAAQLVWELAGKLGVDAPGPDIATAVYVGLVTDTGRFQYSNTTPESFELAAQLMRCGVDVHDVFSTIFETVRWQRAKLLGRALERSIRSDDGFIVATHLRQVDFEECEATEDDAEGIVDALRSVEGAVVAVFLRDLEPGGTHLRKGSLRTTREDVDVSVIARSWTGGGHRQAAGFNTSDDIRAVVERVDEGIRQQLGITD